MKLCQTVSEFMKGYRDQHADNKEGAPKVLFVIDSLGMLLTPTDVDQFEKGEMKGEDENPTEDIDIDLEDPDVQKATVKIQAGYKGMKTRRDLKAGNDNNIEISDAGATPTTEIQEVIDIDLKTQKKKR